MLNKLNPTEKILGCILLSMALLLFAAVSVFVVSDKAASVKYNVKTLEGIDAKSEMVLELTGASTALSAGISALPGDTATPIAEEFADLTSYFLLILCVLYTEKYALTILGLICFKILIPAACVLGIISVWKRPCRAGRLGIKLAVIGLALYIMIPASVRVSDLVYSTYEDTMQTTLSSAEDLTDVASEISEADENTGLIAGILERISETATTLAKKAAKLLNRYIQALAVMIVTACIVPILTLIFFLWLVKQIAASLGLTLPKSGRRGHLKRPPEKPMLEE